MLNGTKIPWVKNPDGSKGYTANPIKGKCKHSCPYCYAEKMRLRFKQSGEISWHPEVLQAIEKLKKPSTIFIGSMYDIWGNWVNKEWIERILHTVIFCKDNVSATTHTFLFLTKNPERYKNFFTNIYHLAKNKNNFWLGITITNIVDYEKIYRLMPEQNNYISFEPLLEYIDLKAPEINTAKWIIIGTLNLNGRPVPAENGGTKLNWILGLVKCAKMYNVPIFMKKECYILYPELLEMFGELKALPYLEDKT